MTMPGGAALQVHCLARYRPADLADAVKAGSGKEKALKQAYAHRLQPAPLLQGFDTFSHHRNAKILAAADDRGDNRLFGAANMDIAHQFRIHFDFIRLKTGQ